MSFFYVFDEFYDDPKLAKLPAEAPKLSPEELAVVFRAACIGLWTRAGTWSKTKLTGGHIPRGKIRDLGGIMALAEGLVEAGLWERTPDGYVFHDWEDHQETKVELEEKRERERLKKSAWRRRKSQRTANGGGQSGGHNGGHSGGQRNGHAGGHSGVDAGTTPPKNGAGKVDVHHHVLGDPSPSPSPDLRSPCSPPAGGFPERPGEAAQVTRQLPSESLVVELRDAVDAEYFRRNAQGQRASKTEWLDGADRVLESVTKRFFPDVHAGVAALAASVVTESLKPGGKLGFALKQAAFSPAPTRSAPTPEDLAPRLAAKGSA